MVKPRSNNSRQREKIEDPMYAGFQHIANHSKILQTSDARAMLELERQMGSLQQALRYVGARSKMPRISPAKQEAEQAERRLAYLESSDPAAK